MKKKNSLDQKAYERIINSDIAKKFNPKMSWADREKLKAEYIKKREQ